MLLLFVKDDVRQDCNNYVGEASPQNRDCEIKVQQLNIAHVSHLTVDLDLSSIVCFYHSFTYFHVHCIHITFAFMFIDSYH